MKVTKEITFDSAHMLSNYEGKCNNLHGHTYKLQVTVDKEVDLMSYMTIDFNDLKKVIEETVMDNFDHALLFSSSECRDKDEEELLTWASTFNKKYFILNGKTTCESMAPQIKGMIEKNLLMKGTEAEVHIKLWETPTSFAEC